jgi:hypothetical protein
VKEHSPSVRKDRANSLANVTKSEQIHILLISNLIKVKALTNRLVGVYEEVENSTSPTQAVVDHNRADESNQLF